MSAKTLSTLDRDTDPTTYKVVPCDPGNYWTLYDVYYNDEMVASTVGWHEVRAHLIAAIAEDFGDGDDAA